MTIMRQSSRVAQLMGSLVFSSALGIPISASAQKFPTQDRQLLDLRNGEAATLFGSEYRARTATIAVISQSSDFITVAVISGELTKGKANARSGEALVTPIDGKRTQRFSFDAARLAATVPPQWAKVTTAPLSRLVLSQRRARFWGLLEPVNFNASAPTTPELESVRQSYLNSPVIVSLRQGAQGNPQLLAKLTATAFAQAMVRHDTATLAALVDPKPFTDTAADAASWRAGRLAFATALTTDTAMVSALAMSPVAVANDQTAFEAGGYRIRVVPRDRAMFVQSVELK